VVGPICESGDFFAQDRPLPKLGQGDYLALLSAGAYGFVMASNYNTRSFAAEVLVHGRQAALVREVRSVTDATIENMYGPTETTVWSSTSRIIGVTARRRSSCSMRRVRRTI